MNRRFLAAILFGGFAFAAPAPSPFPADEPLPKADTILDRYIEVTGGKAVYQARKSEHAMGTMDFKAQGLKGSVTRYAAPPSQLYISIELEGVGKIESGVTDGVAWEKSAIMGARIKTGEERAQTLREARFNGTLFYKELYTKVETTGMETIDGEPCYKVVLTPADGKPETMFFQKKSGLVVKTAVTAVSQMGEIQSEAITSDYKSFGGVLVPTKVIQRAGGQEFSISIDKVIVNEPIPAERFELPAEIKALQSKAAEKK